MYTDPISDMLTRIRNAVRAGHKSLAMPHSKLKESLASLMVKEGFLEGVNVKQVKTKQLEVTLKYDKNGRSVITDLSRVSTPGQRIYTKSTLIPKSHGGFGITVVSTSKGLMTDKQARAAKHGGEVLCKVW